MYRCIMERDISPDFQRWMQKRLQRQFASAIENALEKNCDTPDIAHRIVRSKEMRDLMTAVKAALAESKAASGPVVPGDEPHRRPMSMSLASDQYGDDEWSPLKYTRSHLDSYDRIVEKINYGKPIHIRLAGYEFLSKNELANVTGDRSWDALLKALRDGIADESRPIFEASLQVHARLLDSPRSHDVLTNLLSAFNAQYHSRRSRDTLPTLSSGANFKVFLHDKLFRLVHLIVRHQEHVLRNLRNVDKVVEDTIEQFVEFLSSAIYGNSAQTKTLSTLNILSILEPRANWSRKWIHSLATRKALFAALVKSPVLLRRVVISVNEGLAKMPISTSISMSDEPADVHVPGDTIETLSYLHCLQFLTQLCGKASGRALLMETRGEETPFSVPEFMLKLLNSLNILASSNVLGGMYEELRGALRQLLEGPVTLYDARFYHVALSPFSGRVNCDDKIWPHTIDVMMHMLDTTEGSRFVIFEYRTGSDGNPEKESSTCPAADVLAYASNLLRQPFSMMDVGHIVDLLKLSEKLFDLYDVYDGIVRDTVQDKLYPALTYLYGRMNKYSVENENKTQHLDSATRSMLLKIIVAPLGLQMLNREELLFKELIRGSVAPLRASWNFSDIVSFVSSTSSIALGFKALSDIAPQILSTLLTNLYTVLNDSRCFHNPWDDSGVKEFLRLLGLLSLNTKCFLAFMIDSLETVESEDSDYPSDLHKLLQHSVNFDSPYHHLGLLALKSTIWNMDVYVYLESLFNFQEKLQANVGESEEVSYAIRESSLLRRQILFNCHQLRCRPIENAVKPEECVSLSSLPPLREPEEIKTSASESSSSSELCKFLELDKTELKDSDWVSRVRKAHKASTKGSIENSMIIDLLDRMEKAVPTLELTSDHEWPVVRLEEDVPFPEDAHGIELVLRYAEQNGILQNDTRAGENLRVFIRQAHEFIRRRRPSKYEGFDWFLATIFLVCRGNLERCKTFVIKITRFPSAMFLWMTLNRTTVTRDADSNSQLNVQFSFAQLLDNIVTKELHPVKYALKSNYGIDWWMMCDNLISQVFWGSLPWNEIVHLLAICILHPPDYLLYYCVSLLRHCQPRLLEDIAFGRTWPEHMVLDDYRCHDNFAFMERLAKRYRNKVLPELAARGRPRRL